MKSFQNVRERFPAFWEAIVTSHEKAKLCGHHDACHAMRVGQFAYAFAFDEYGDESIANLAGLAGLAHNADRIIEAENGQRNEASEASVVELLEHWWSMLPSEYREDAVTKKAFILAVLAHSRKNDVTDTPILVALKDADRVVNLGLDIVMRTAQHYHELPTVDFKHWTVNSEASYKDPKTVLKSVVYCLEWAQDGTDVSVRTRLGMQIAKERAQVLRGYITELQKQLIEENVLS